jgi:hypothetical protein
VTKLAQDVNEQGLNVVVGAAIAHKGIASSGACLPERQRQSYAGHRDHKRNAWSPPINMCSPPFSLSPCPLQIIAEWYHVESMLSMKFFDDNTRSWWTPATGACLV